MIRPLLSLLVILVGITPSPLALAQPPVVTRDCPPDLSPLLESRLRVELSMASEALRVALERGEVRLEVSCAPTAAMARARGPTVVEQRVEGAPVAEVRRVAIALLELGEASLLAAGERERPPNSAPARPAWLALTGGVSIAGVPPLVLGAVGLTLELPLIEPVALVVDLDAGLGGMSIAEGSIDAGVVSLGVSLRFGGWLGIVELGAGPAVRGGAVVFVGSASAPGATGRTHVGPWLGLGAAAGVGVRLGDQLRIGLDLAGGGALLGTGALARGVLQARYGDAWLDLRASVGVIFP